MRCWWHNLEAPPMWQGHW